MFYLGYRERYWRHNYRSLLDWHFIPPCECSFDADDLLRQRCDWTSDLPYLLHCCLLGGNDTLLCGQQHGCYACWALHPRRWRWRHPLAELGHPDRLRAATMASEVVCRYVSACLSSQALRVIACCDS